MIIDRLNFYPFLSQGNCINPSLPISRSSTSHLPIARFSPRNHIINSIKEFSLVYPQLHQGILTRISTTPSGNPHLYIPNSFKEFSLAHPQLLQGILTCISPTRLPCLPKFLPDIFYPMLAPQHFLSPNRLSSIRLSPVYLLSACLPSISYTPISYPATPNLPTPTCPTLACPTPTCLTLTC